jgi:hypothetical protein
VDCAQVLGIAPGGKFERLAELGTPELPGTGSLNLCQRRRITGFDVLEPGDQRLAAA